MNDKEQRAWTRYELTMTADVKSGDTSHSSAVQDFSAGGASLQGPIPANDVQSVNVTLDNFGEFPASVVRDWDDGYAVMFELSDEDRYSLQDDVSSFMRENDLMDD